jgi:hypothetical protein
LFKGFKKYKNLKHSKWFSEICIPLHIQQRLLKYHDEKSVVLIKENPYLLSTFGMAFNAVDKIANTHFSVEQDAKSRLISAFEEALRRNEGAGHTRILFVGEAITQSSEGIHQWNADNDTACGELVLNFNVNARVKGEGVVIDTFKNGTLASFCSNDLSTEKLSKCMGEAFDYLSVKISHKAQLIRSLLLSLVGIVLFCLMKKRLARLVVKSVHLNCLTASKT